MNYPPESSLPPRAPSSQTYGEAGQRIQLSEEDRQIMKECASESYWYRSLPLALLAGGFTHYYVTVNKLSGGRFGSIPKVLAGAAFGYIGGKISYISTCREKFIQSQTSPIGKQLREAISSMHQGRYQVQQHSQQPETFSSAQSGYRADDQHVNLDLDTSESNTMGEFDVSKLIAEEEEEKSKPPEMTKTYSQIRRENRAKFDQRPVMPPTFQRQENEQRGHVRHPPKNEDRDEFTLGRSKKMRKNQYGDIVYDE